MSTPPERFRPNPRLARWLRAGDVQLPESAEGADWDGWLLRQMNAGEIVTVGGVLVDRQVLRQRFACVSERCAPRRGRGAFRSCCADAAVALDSGERRRLARIPELACEPWEDDGFLAHCDGRCVLSQIDAHGRIRCRLHALARRRGVDRSEIQPLSCRLFPLIVLDFGQGRVALTLISTSTWRLVQAHPPKRYPCLADPALPPLTQALRGDLDWAFGKGFARALARRAAQG